jgi:ABC-type enterochelin transport system substrate-binding protein
MKKLLLVLAIAGFAVACNNDAEKKEEKTDSTSVSTEKMGTDTTIQTSTDTTVTHKDSTKM